MDKIAIHKALCDGTHQLYIDKNGDYGDSFANVRKKHPNAILIRLNDKLSRLETLMSGHTQRVSDESIDDTLRDLANYCLMELVERAVDEATKDEADEKKSALWIGETVIDMLDVGQTDNICFTMDNGAVTLKKGLPA